MALSEVLPFDQWVDSEEAAGLEGLEKVKAYGDHYRSTTFASGNYNSEEAQQVDTELLSLAVNSGFLDPEDEEAMGKEWMSSRRPLGDDDLAKVVAHKYENKQDGEEQVRRYLKLRNIEGTPQELLDQSAEEAAPFLTKQDLQDAGQASAFRGDQAFSVSEDEEGNLDIEFDPSLDESTLTNERIAQIAKEQGINSRFLPVIRKQLEAPSGLTVSYAKAKRNDEIRTALHETEDEDLIFFRDMVVEQVKNGDLTAAASYAEDASNYGSLSKNYGRGDIVTGLLDFAKRHTVGDNPVFLSTGEVVMPKSLMTRAKEFDAAVDALDITPQQKALTKASRSLQLSGNSHELHRVATAIGGSDYTEHFEKGQAEGKDQSEILQDWFEDDKNYSELRVIGMGGVVGIGEGVVGIPLSAMALAGDEEALKAMQSFQQDDADRRAYAQQFGEDHELGIGYTLIRTAPSVVADIALSIPTAGAVGTFSAGAKWTARQAFKATLRESLDQTTKSATKAALKKGAPGSVAKALQLTGSNFTTKLKVFTKQSVAVAPTAFYRSAGASYASSYSSLKSQNPEWSEEKLREVAYGHAVTTGAITVGIVSVFNGLSQVFPKIFGSGVEEWAKGSGGGLNIRQLRKAYGQIALVPNKLPKDMKNYIKLDSFEEFVGSVAKQGMKNSFALHTLRQSSSEAMEEGLDQFVNGWRESALLNEDKSLLEHLREAGHAAVIGGVFGVGGALKEGGIRSSASARQTQQFEQDVFGTIADGLENGGDFESASVLRGLIARSRNKKTAVTQQLEKLGSFAERQSSQVSKQAEAEIAPLRKVMKGGVEFNSQLQRELEDVESRIQALEEGYAPGQTLSTKGRVQLAALRVLRERITEAANADVASEADATRAAADMKADESSPESEGRAPVTKGQLVGKDRGTAHSEFADKYSASTPEEADSVIEELNAEIARLGSRGSEATAYQNERVKYLSEQRDLIKAQFAPEPLSPATAPGDGGPGARATKLNAQLRVTESGLGALRKLEAANPSIKNLPAHRARKVALRSRRRALREAMVNTPDAARAAKPVSWRQYPLEKLATQYSLLVGLDQNIIMPKAEDSPVYDPVGNTQFDPNVDPQAAVDIIEKASKEKRKMDEATVKKIEQGKTTSQAELESLATEDPDLRFAEMLENLQKYVAASIPDPVGDSGSTNPGAAQQVRSLEAAKQVALEQDDKKDLPVEGAPEVQEEVGRLAGEMEEADPGPAPRTATYTLEGTDAVIEVTEGGVTFYDNSGNTPRVEDVEPTESFEEAEAVVQKYFADNGIDESTITRTETETDPNTERLASVSAGDTGPLVEGAGDPPAQPSAEQTETEEQAKAAFIEASLRATQTGQTASEVLEEEIKKAKAEFKIGEHIVPMLNVSPPKGWGYYYKGAPVAIKGYDPEKHVIATEKGKHKAHYKKGFITLVNKKTGRPLKPRGEDEVIKLYGEGVTLSDDNGAPQFLRAEDRVLFYKLVEDGVPIERRAFLDGTYSLASDSQYYRDPFIRTLQAEILKRYPVAENPPQVIRKTDPDPSLQKVSVKYKYTVSTRDGMDPSVTRADLLARKRELEVMLVGTRKGREEASINRALEEENEAFRSLAEAKGELSDAAISYDERAGTDLTVGETLSSESSLYYDLLKKRAVAESEVNRLTNELRGHKESVKDTVLGKDASQQALAEEFIQARQDEVTEAQELFAELSQRLAKLTDPRTLPNLSEAEVKYHKAKLKTAEAIKAVKQGKLSDSAIQVKILDIENILFNLPKEKETVVEFELYKGTELSAKQELRLAEMHKNHTRGLRADAKNSKISRNGITHNVAIPIIEEVYENEDGTTRTTQKVFFNNDPLSMAEARNLGYEIKVPAKYREEGSKRNPSIKVSADGFVTDVYHPLRLKLVKSPGDLLQFGLDTPYVPREIRHSARAKYVGALPPVRLEDVPRLGNTAANVEADAVQSVVDKDAPDSSGPDGAYLIDAANFFDGVIGGNRRATPSQGKVKRARVEAQEEYGPKIEQLREQIKALKEIRSNEALATEVVVPGDLAFDPASLDGDSEGLTVNEAGLDELITRAEEELSEATAANVEADAVQSVVDKDAIEAANARLKSATSEYTNVQNELRAHENAPTPKGKVAKEKHREKGIALEEKLGTEKKQGTLLKEISDANAELALAEKNAEDRIAGDTSELEARLEGLRSIRDTMQQARESLIDSSTGEQVAPANLDELLRDLTSQLESTVAVAREKVKQAESEVEEETEEVVQTGIYQSPEITDLLGLVEKAGGSPEDARTVALLMYKQEIREFGIALQLLEQNNKGTDPVKWFGKFLKRLPSDSRSEIMAYIRSRHTTKVERPITLEQAVAFFEETKGLQNSTITGVTKALRNWVKGDGKINPDKLTMKQLASFATTIDEPEVRGALTQHLDAEAKVDVDEDFYIKNYVDALLQDITPDPAIKSTSRWVYTPGGEAKPPRFLNVIDSVKRRYADAARNRNVPTFRQVDAPVGDTTVLEVDQELISAIQAQWEGRTEESLGSELAASEFYINTLRSLEQSPAASTALRALAEELGSIEDVESQPLSAVWMATHDIIFRDPQRFDLLSPELQVVVRSIYRSGLRSDTDFGTAEDIQDTIDDNALRHSSRLAKAGIEVAPEERLNPPSLSSDDTRKLAQWYLENSPSSKTKAGSTLFPKHAQVLKLITKALDSDSHKGWPTVSFLSKPNAAYAQYTGAYSSEARALYLNLSKPDPYHSETFLRGLLQHTISSINTSTEEGQKAYAGLLDVAGDIANTFPGDVGFVSSDLSSDVPARLDTVRFAMNDPVAFATLSRKNPSFVSRLTDAMAKLLNLSGSVAKSRLGALLEPKPGQVWGGEPKTSRHTPSSKGTTERSIDVLNRLAPAGVKVEVSSDNPQPAWVTTSSPDKVFVNLESIDSFIGNLSPEGKEQVLRALLNHELAHLASIRALTDKDRAEILAEMTDADLLAVKSRVPDGTGHLELAEEFLRMKVEQATYGVDSDTFIYSVLNYGTGLRAKFVKYLREFLSKLSSLFQTRPSIRTAVHIERVRDALAGIERGGFDLRPVPSADVEGHLRALEDLEEGTERTFFSVPIHSTDPSVESRFGAWRRRSKMGKEVNQINNQIRFKKTATERLMREAHLRIRLASEKRGTVVISADVNAALGSTDPYLTEKQEGELSALREADVAAGLDPDTVKANNIARIRAAQRGAILAKEKTQQEAIARISRADPELANDLVKFREELTEMSRDVGEIHDGGSLKGVFDDRGNVHLIRSYEFFNSRAFQDAAKAAKDDKGIPGYEGVPFNSYRTLAIEEIQDQHLRKYGKKISGKRARQILIGMLNEWSQLRPEQFSVNTLLKSSSLFEERQNLPEGLRSLLGQRSNLDSAMDTALKLGSYLAKHEAADSTRKLLVGNEWAFESPDAIPGVALTPLWSPLQSDGDYAALHGLYARPEDKKIIEETLSGILSTTGPESDTLAKNMSNFTKRVFGTSLTMKTLFQIGFYTRNEGNMSFVMLPMQGIWGGALGFMGGSGKGRAAGRVALGGVGIGRLAEGKEEYTLELIRHGIVKDEVTAGLIRDIHGRKNSLGTDVQKDLDEFAGGGKPKGWLKKSIARVLKSQGVAEGAIESILSGAAGYDKLVSAMAKVNEAIDAKGKILMYEYELDILKKARDDSSFTGSDEDLKALAADKVRKTLPGHSQVYKPINSLTRSNLGLLIAPFARFKGETVRTVINTLPLAWSEWKMGVQYGSATLKKRAMNRAISFGLVFSFWEQAFAYLVSKLFDGANDREDEDGGFIELRGEVGKTLRSGLPKWAQGHTIFARRNSDGTITTYDLTYYTHLSLIKDPIKVFMDRANTDGLDEGVKGFVNTLAHDLVGEGIGPGALREILSNSDDYGREIYLETDDAGVVAQKMVSHYLTNALEPGIVRKGRQLAISLSDRKDEAVNGDRYYDATNLLLGEATGVKPFEYRETELMKRSARQTKRQLDLAKQYLSPLNSSAFKTEEEIKEAILDYNDAYVELWKQHRRNAAAWSNFTGDESSRAEYARLMVLAGQSKDRTRKAIYGGILDRYQRNRKGLENMYRAGDTDGAEGGETRVQNAVDGFLEQPRFHDLTD